MKPPPYAMEMAEQGIPTFPCNSEKKPCCARGFYAATTDPKEMEALWRRSPGPLIGMPTGPASGLDLLDIDPRHGGLDWLAEFSSFLPDTRTVQTRSGGTHFFHLHLPGMRNSESKIAPGVDVRGEGGYAILWIPTGGFLVRDLPAVAWAEWVAEKALPGKAAVQFDPDTGEIHDGAKKPIAAPRRLVNVKEKDERTDEEIALDLIEAALQNVRHASSGNLHYSLRSASRTIGGFIGKLGFSDEDAIRKLCEAANSAGAKDTANAEKTIKSGIKLGKSQPLTIRARR